MDKCLFVIPLRTGAFLIAVLDILSVIFGYWKIVEFFRDPKESHILLKVFNMIDVVALIFVLISSIMLLYAAHKSLYKFLMPWIVVNGLDISLVIVETVAIITLRGLHIVFLVNAFFIGLYIYFGICMLHYFKELKDEEVVEEEE